MGIVKRTEYEKATGNQVIQWLAGCAGAVVTTLPAFIVLPIWFAFIYHYRVVDKEGKNDDITCGLICFTAGMWCWILFIVAIIVSDHLRG